MAKRIYVEDLSKHIGEKVELKGWVYNKRGSKKIKFLIFRDGTGLLQCVYFKGECEEASFNLFDELNQETTVKVTGV
ncbi:MAG: asparagine--tRNA ligase, partial [Bdellovibrionales bacterium]|nr:asparagine--tRNA ligase [Bdellovibrionales bacterium]